MYTYDPAIKRRRTTASLSQLQPATGTQQDPVSNKPPWKQHKNNLPFTLCCYFNVPRTYQSTWLCKTQRGCVSVPLSEKTLNLAHLNLSQKLAKDRKNRHGEWEVRVTDGKAVPRARESAGQHSPAQVAIHGFHIVILAARKGAQLVEGHSWSQRQFMQLKSTIPSHGCQAQSTNTKHQRTPGEKARSSRQPWNLR